MKPLRINLNLKALDGFLYNGELFIITSDGILATITFKKVIEKAIQFLPEYTSLFNLSFLRNDWLNNEQGIIYQEFGKMQKELYRQWQKLSDITINIEITEQELFKHFECPSLPIFDIKAYAMRIYLGHRNGLHEAQMSFDKNTNELYLHEPVKVFDARSSFIAAKSGEIIVSSNTDGLFSGSIWGDVKNAIKIRSKRIADKSLRTGWSGFDLINYEEQAKFFYFKNETELVKGKEVIRYSNIDEQPEKNRITEYCIEKYSLDDLLSRREVFKEGIKYIFNTNQSVFFVLANNKLINLNIFDTFSTGEKYLSRRDHELPFKAKIGKNRPLSSAIVPKGTLLEFYDKVFLIHHGETQLIMDEPIYTNRTFPGSKRFKNLILFFYDGGISIQSIFPFEKPITSD